MNNKIQIKTNRILALICVICAAVALLLSDEKGIQAANLYGLIAFYCIYTSDRLEDKHEKM